MSRTDVRRRGLAVAAAVGSCLLFAAPAMGRGTDARPSGVRYVVRPGDTLWSVARTIGGGGDPRSMVDAIQRANHLDPGALVPGRTITIPAP